jgi:diamine N-acetyltransferase
VSGSACIAIRVATAADAGILADLGARTFRDTFGGNQDDQRAADFLTLTFNPAVKSGDLADPEATFLIAEIDGGPVGYAKLRFGFAPNEVDGSAPMEIARFFADTPWIGHGVGAALMEQCLSLAGQRRCDVVWLDVRDTDERAPAFYEKWGFVALGSRAPGWTLMARPVTAA